MAGDGTLYQRKPGTKCYLIYNTGNKIINKKGKERYEQVWIDLETTEKSVAKEKAKIVRADLTKKGYHYNTKATVEELVTGWLKSCETRISPRTKKRLNKRTIEEYEKIVRVHIIPNLGSEIANKVTPKQIREFIGDKSLISQFIARKIYIVLNLAYRQAVMDEEIQENPCIKVVAPSQPKIKHPIWTADQAMLFLEQSKKHHPLFKYGIFLMSLHQGLRIGEILGLPIENVNLKNSTAVIDQKLTRIKGQWIIEKILKTDNTKRTIILTPTVTEVLRELIKDRKEGLVFTAEQGGCVRLENLRNRGFNSLIRMYNNKASEDKKLPQIRIHDMRHSAGTLLYKLFKDIKLVQLYLGHATISMAADTYVHDDLEMLQEAVEAMDMALKNTVNT
jgi:integrase